MGSRHCEPVAGSGDLPVSRFDRARANRIVAAVVDFRSVSSPDIYSQTRGPAVRARQEAMWLMRAQRVGSFPAIGRRFGKHHTTVMGAIRSVDRRMHNPAYRREIDAMQANLDGQAR